MIAFTIILIGLLDIVVFVKKTSFKRRAMVFFCSLYPIIFSLAYLGDWIPYGLLYTGITETNVIVSNMAYFVFQIWMVLFPDPQIKQSNNVEISNVYFGTIIIILVFVVYFIPYAIQLTSILQAPSFSRRILYNGISSVASFRILINMYVCLSFYSISFRQHKICLIINILLITIINGLSVYCGNRREVVLVLLLLLPLIVSKAKEHGGQVAELLSDRKRKMIMIFGTMLILYMFVIPFIRQGRELSSNSILLAMAQIIGNMDFNAPYQTLAFEMNHSEEFVYLSSYIKAIPKVITGVFHIPIDVSYTMESFVAKIGDYFGYKNYTVGWTYSPFSEAYISFGYLGLFFIFPFVVTFLLYYNSRNKAYSDFDKGLFLMFAYQFFRGDFANFMHIYVTYKLIIFLIKSLNEHVRLR